MQSMVHGTPSEDLIRELKMHSPTSTRLNDGFRRVYGDVNILTFYEMEPTASLRKNEFDTWERSGPPVMMVEKDSAILYWSMETRIGLNQDHSRIAKVDRGQNGCYDDICHFLQQSLGSTHKSQIKPNVNRRPHSSTLPNSSNGIFVTGHQLCKAIEKGDSKKARDLVQSIEKGSLAKLPGNPLYLALVHCPEIVSTLLDAGADLSARITCGGAQVIHFTGRYAKSPDTVQLLINAGADVNSRGDEGWMPLHYATFCDSNPEIVQVLIDAGASVNAPNTLGNTPLHCAAQGNHNPDIIQVLLDAGAEVNAPNTLGNTPLHCAAQNSNNPAIIQVLLDAGASVNSFNTLGNTPLHLAAECTTSEGMIWVLSLANANINARNNQDDTPLHHAARYNNTLDIIRALIKANADVNATTVDGSSPLALSTSNDNPEICRELLIAGAHPNRSNKRGYTALHTAVAHGNKAIVSHLLESGADPQAMSEDGYTPKTQGFNHSVPFETRKEIDELISKATRPSGVRVEIKKSKGLGRFFQ